MDLSRYRVVYIPKATGGVRRILEPDRDLKQQQRSILAWLMAHRLRPSIHAHGFIRKRSTTTNARPHVGKRTVVRFDIQDFFPSITSQQVLHALLREGLSREDAGRVTELCTVEGRLPQGAPTSPFLSNVVFKPLDYRLAGLATRWSAAYTRYADDLVFSSDRKDLNHIYHAVARLLIENGFSVNARKFRVHRHGRRQLVTGIVVNRGLDLPREQRRTLRAAIHNAREAIIAGNGDEPDLRSLEGKAAYLAGIHPEHGRRALEAIRNLRALLRMRDRFIQS